MSPILKGAAKALTAAGIGGGIMSLPQEAEAAPFGTLARQLGRRTREAWHGGPHTYDQVDLSHMGSGEGAQAYGAGYYAADLRGVAEDYQRQLSRTRRFGGQPYNIDDPQHVAAYWTDHFYGDRKQALQYIEDHNATAREFGMPERADVAEVLRSGEPLPEVTTPSGALYRLEIPDEDLLDWDAPLSEQPEGVRYLAQDFDLPESATGGDFYRALVGQNRDAAISRGADRVSDTTLSGSQAAASRDLAAVGIPGIRYLDGASRSAGEGTRNYVIFDDRNVNVVERNGQPIAAMPRGRGEGFATPEMMALLGGAGAGITGAEAIAPLLLAPQGDTIEAPRNEALATLAEMASSAETGLPLYGSPFQETGNVLNRIAYGDYGEGMSPELAFDAAMAGLELFDPVSYLSLLAQRPSKEMRSGGMTQGKYPLKAAAEELASKGRYGDTRLVHINEAELQGIASLAPGGKLTINPDTGQPEAFLPFLAPILGSVLGTTFLPGAATAIGLGGLGAKLAAAPALAGALGSGLATGLAENSLEKGLLAGVTGFGMGSALGAAGNAFGGAAKEGVKRAGEEAVKNALGEAATQAASGLPQAGVQAGLGDAAVQSIAGQITPQAAVAAPTLGQGIQTLGMIGQNFGDVMGAAMSPGTMLPVSYGLGSLAELRAQDARRDAYNRRINPSVEQGRRFQNTLTGSLQEAGRRYGFEAGGITSVNPDQYRSMREGAIRFATGGSTEVLQGSPGQRQAALRGPDVLAPPEGYRPGIDPEFMFFGTAAADPSAPAPAPVADPFAAVPDSVVNRYRQVARDLGNFNVQQDLSGRNIRNRQQYTPEFNQLRTQYPGLTFLDEELKIDDQFRTSGADPVTSNLPGAVVGGGIASLAPPAQISPALGTAEFYQNLFAGDRSRAFMAEGGMTEGAGELVEEVIKAILGQHENGDMVIEMFVEKHGPEAFAQLRTQVLNGVVPGAQTEGQMKGPGGGMDDQLPGMIGSSQPVALSTDEFVVPADVVSALGDGSSDAGAEVLYEMMDSVRRYKGGKTEQPPKMSPEKLEQIKLGRP